MATVKKITSAVVLALQPGEEIRDEELRGFGVRRQQGKPTYFVQIRIQGRMKRLTIGPHGTWTPETARRHANGLLLDVRRGGNPVADREARRLKELSASELLDRFLSAKNTKLKPRTLQMYTYLIKDRLKPKLGTIAVSALDLQTINHAHSAWSKEPRNANHALAVLSAALNWAEANGYRSIGSNPCPHVERYPEVERRRFLTEGELNHLGAVLRNEEADNANPVIIAAIRLLLLTGARLTEVLTLRWSYVDLERGMLSLPDSKTGAKVILLSTAAVDTFQRLPRLENSPWVLPGLKDGQHLVNLQKAWRAIRAKANLDDVRLHDLRHSYASFAAGLGGSLPVIGNLLGHSRPETTARYAHIAPSIAKTLANAVGEHLAAPLAPATHPLPSPRPQTLPNDDSTS